MRDAMLLKLSSALFVAALLVILSNSSATAEWKHLGLADLVVRSVRFHEGMLYAGTSDGVYRRSLGDSLATWIAMGLQGREIWPLVIVSGDTILAGSRLDSVLIYRTDDGGITWYASDSGIEGASQIPSMALIPGQVDTMYATVMGLSRSVDSGRSWHQVFDMGGLVFVEVDPFKHNVVWTGGENFFYQPQLFKSIDAGETWSTIDIWPPGDNRCHDIAFYPGCSDTALVSMESVVRKTFDGGNTWQDILTNEHYLYSIQIDSLRPGNLYTVGGAWYQPLTLFFSKDFGHSWSSAIDSTYAENTAINMTLVSYSDRNELYLATLHGVFLFTDDRPYYCGNVDGIIGPGGAVDVADLSYLVEYLFIDGPPPPVMEAANVDGIIGPGGPVDVADLMYLVAFLFAGGPPPCP